MANQRISHSLLDPYMIPLVPKLYKKLHIPNWFPPEGIVITGHLLAILGGVGFALSTTYWWAGLLAAVGVFGNHLADMIDGTHARSTGQCRNGGELLDHFFDPLSFAYWIIGISFAISLPYLGIAGVLAIFTQAVLTSIKAKMTSQFTLATFGPTEFKILLTLFALTMAVSINTTLATYFLWILVGIGIVSVIVNLVRSVIEVNRDGEEPDTTEWVIKQSNPDTRKSSACPNPESFSSPAAPRASGAH